MTPPTTPPAMAPALVFLPWLDTVGVKVGVLVPVVEVPVGGELPVDSGASVKRTVISTEVKCIPG